jgi:hypothetical protein
VQSAGVKSKEFGVPTSMTNENKPPVSDAQQSVVDLLHQNELLRARIAELEAGKPVDRMGAWDDRFSGSAKEIEAHTIDRCAQELEAAHAECSTLSLLHGAARLRALKDKP